MAESLASRGQRPHRPDGGRPRPRRAHLDNLKVTLVAAVVLAHVLITYGDLGSWAYREPSTNPAFLVPTALVLSVASLFAMGLLFLVAGLMTPGALARKGHRAFLRDRVARLGTPFLLYLVLVYPFVRWLGSRGEHSLWWYLDDQRRVLDPGPLWFVGVLLVYSVGYVAWRGMRPGRALLPPFRPAVLVAAGAFIALGSFVVRLVWPIDSGQPFAAHLWQWPQCLGMFALGLACAEHQWLDPVPDAVHRRCGWWALGGVAVVVAAFAVSGDDFESFAGGLTWQAAVTAAAEAAISVGLGIWLLSHFQRRHDTAGPLARELGRSAYGAYVVQAPVVVGVAVAMAGARIAPELKVLLVAPAALVASFGLAWLLTRAPGVRRLV